MTQITNDYLNIELDRARLQFDPAQGLDLRHLWIDDIDLAPGTGAGEGQPGLVARGMEGFIMTCGPDHIRQPCRENGTDWPLHGSFIHSNAEHISVTKKKDRVEINAKIPVEAVDGGRMIVYRQYRLRMGSSGFRLSINDRIKALSGPPVRPMMMYHLNIPRRLFLPNARILDFPIPPSSYHHCSRALPVTRLCGLAGPVSAICVASQRQTLDWTQLWSNDRMFCIEPVTLPLAPRSHLAATGNLETLAAGNTFNCQFQMGFILA